MAYALGNFVETGLGWRWVFFIASMPGFVVAAIILLAVKEPLRGGKDPQGQTSSAPVVKAYSLKDVLAHFVSSPSLLLLCLGGAFRNAGVESYVPSHPCVYYMLCD